MATLLSTTGVGCAFRPARIADLLSYYDPDDITSFRQPSGAPVTSDGQDIGRWMDRSGNAQHYDLVAQEAASANYPQYATSVINGHPGVNFLGASGIKQSVLFNGAYGNSPFAQFTVMLVAQIGASDGAWSFLSGKHNGASLPDQTPDGFLVSAPSDHTKLDFKKDLPTGFSLQKVVDGSPALFTFIVDDATTPPSGLFYFNGGTAASGTDAGGGTSMTLDGICIAGRYGAVIDQSMPFKCRDLAIYARRLSLAELNRLGQFMMAKSGASTSLSEFL